MLRALPVGVFAVLRLPPPGYQRVSPNGRLAAGLLALSRWLDQVGIHDADLNRHVDHLWSWFEVGRTEEFGDWYGTYLEDGWFGTGDMPERLAQACVRVGLPRRDLEKALASADEILAGGLFSSDNEVERQSATNLSRLARLIGRYHLRLPPSEWFLDPTPAEGAPSRLSPQHGRDPTWEEVSAWRRANWE